ncbi:hypothetical protein GCM10025867_27270 [Frondihabitans sucicola]|uniref:ABC transporter domain-containing protein n=1 Tax=Frondihabitans sucicola TaxID=1268041 RepID=A0ABN6XZW7_9MICO|nr:ATP-binding cassette domain-containing protein [Frondihabitans sucicola]BDZ50486.1 hypothetical protein GCM10025867_27270 [Frondihabitans sucicola]
MTLELRGIGRRFSADARALDDVSLTIRPGEFLAIVGPSGGGKSTLLNTIGLLDVPDEGTFLLEGTDTARLPERERARLRSTTFGFVFQGFHLLDARPAIDSIELGLLYRALPTAERLRRAREALAAVGLAAHAEQRASLLSGGQRQRVAIARALAASARVVVADEPTGNLDSVNGAQVMNALRALHDDGCTIVLVTHDPALAATADRIAHLRDGRIHLLEDLAPKPSESTRITPSDPRSPGEATGSTPAPPGPTPPRGSRVRPRDVLRDAFRTVRSRPGRTTGLVAAVATAVALAIATLGISGSASAQVSDRFDLHVNRDVTVVRDDAALAPVSDPDPDPRDRRHATLRDDTAALLAGTTILAGVDHVGIVYERGTTTIQATPTRPALQAPAVSATGDVRRAARLTIRWTPNRPHRLADGEVLIGGNLAAQLPLGSLAAAPSSTSVGRTSSSRAPSRPRRACRPSWGRSSPAAWRRPPSRLRTARGSCSERALAPPSRWPGRRPPRSTRCSRRHSTSTRPSTRRR